MKLNFPAPVPEIPVSDLFRALEYYKQMLGFQVDWQDDSIGLAGISRHECRLFLATESFRSANGNVAPLRIWINLDSKDAVDDLYGEWKECGAIIQAAPESKPWGLHEFTEEDSDGNLFRIFYDFATPEREAGASN